MSEVANQVETVDMAGDLSGRFLTFILDGASYGLPLQSVIEIISIQGITNVPMLPNYISGIINLRGKIVPVVDIRVKLGMNLKPFDMYTCIVVVTIGDLSLGIIVDKVNAVITADAKDMTNPPASVSGGAQQLSTIINSSEGVTLILALDKLFAEELNDSYRCE